MYVQFFHVRTVIYLYNVYSIPVIVKILTQKIENMFFTYDIMNEMQTMLVQFHILCECDYVCSQHVCENDKTIIFCVQVKL